jgi:putative pyruvate formate lyase activating enzyme
MLTRRGFLKHLLGSSSYLLLAPLMVCAEQRAFGAWTPAYIKLERSGDLQRRVEAAYAIFDDCRLCPRQCGVNRPKGERGYCRAPAEVMVYSANPHFGEEASLVGRHGSGTIFFSNCNLRCVFCQNWPISIEGHGKAISDDDLAAMMLRLQAMGCHNINLVTPTHVMPNIIGAVRIACRKGLNIQLVYNTSGYERGEILKLLDGVVDIYLPDMKYMDAQKASRYSSGASDYPEKARAAILEMHRQVGVHHTDENGIALRGLMIRHLVMPHRVAGTREFVDWVAQKLPLDTYVNIMHQYHVAYKAFEYPEIWRAITDAEYLEAMQWAQDAGLTHLDPDSKRFRSLIQRQKRFMWGK